WRGARTVRDSTCTAPVERCPPGKSKNRLAPNRRSKIRAITAASATATRGVSRFDVESFESLAGDELTTSWLRSVESIFDGGAVTTAGAGCTSFASAGGAAKEDAAHRRTPRIS